MLRYKSNGIRYYGIGDGLGEEDGERDKGMMVALASGGRVQGQVYTGPVGYSSREDYPPSVRRTGLL